MPYLQIYVATDKSETEAQATLNYLRDNFPLKQSEGRFYRRSSHYILFEQSEHMVLTLEQELWLESHGGETLVKGTRFYSSRDEGCRLCDMPFNDAPTGYCPQCYTANPYLMTALTLQLSPEEYQYVQYVARHVWGKIESTYLRHCVLTLLHLIERGGLALAEVASASADRFTADVNTYVDEQRNICRQCGWSKEQCKCLYPAQLYEQLFGTQQHVQPQGIPITRREEQRIQALAEDCGLNAEAFVRCSLGLPEVRMAAASREAAVGRILDKEMDFQLPRAVQGFKESGLLLVGDVDRNSFGSNLYHLASTCSSMVGAIPLLDTSVLDIMFDLRCEPQDGQYLTLPRTQLVEVDAFAAQAGIGCTHHEMEALEQKGKLCLPAVYKEFRNYSGKLESG